MAELVYATDLKSVALTGLRVRVPLVVPLTNEENMSDRYAQKQADQLFWTLTAAGIFALLSCLYLV